MKLAIGLLALITLSLTMVDAKKKPEAAPALTMAQMPPELAIIPEELDNSARITTELVLRVLMLEKRINDLEKLVDRVQTGGSLSPVISGPDIHIVKSN